MTAARRLTAHLVLLLSLLHLARAPYELTLRSNFGGANSFQTDNRGDEDNISPPISWTGVPKNTESYVLIFESTKKSKNNDAGDDSAPKAKTHWLLYDIPKEVTELREELSGNGASDVSRLGMKDDAGQAPVVVDPMGAVDGWVDPEIKAMQDMIHTAMDLSFDDANRAKEGATSFGGLNYRGPTRKDGSELVMKLYALSGRLDELKRGASKEEVVKAMKGKVLAMATLRGSL